MEHSKSSQEFHLELKRIKTSIKRRLKSATKYLAKTISDKKKCHQWRDEYHVAELLQANFTPVKKESLEVLDWETGKQVSLSLNPRLKLHEEIAKRFKYAKKLKKGIPYAEKQNLQAEKEVEKWKEQLLLIDHIDSTEKLEEIKNILPIKKKITLGKQEKPKSYWEYYSESNIPIWVGRNASCNDLLTFHLAHGNDLWLHIVNIPGSHIVIHKLSREEDIDTETLQDALHLAIYHSKARNQKEGEVSLTQVKHVKRLGRQKGRVQIANEKRIFIKLDLERINKLTLRNP